jgi:hypothetical protein
VFQVDLFQLDPYQVRTLHFHADLFIDTPLAPSGGVFSVFLDGIQYNAVKFNFRPGNSGVDVIGHPYDPASPGNVTGVATTPLNRPFALDIFSDPNGDFWTILLDGQIIHQGLEVAGGLDTIRLSLADYGSPDSRVLADNLLLEALPEPGGLTLLAGAALAVAVTLRRLEQRLRGSER